MGWASTWLDQLDATEIAQYHDRHITDGDLGSVRSKRPQVKPPRDIVVIATGESVERVSAVGGYDYMDTMTGYPNRTLMMYYQSKQCSQASRERTPPSTCFYCPISHDIMEDPVILPDVHSFEHRPIEAWVKEHGTSPITRTSVAVEDIRPNHALRNLIGKTTSHPSTGPRNWRVSPLSDAIPSIWLHNSMQVKNCCLSGRSLSNWPW